MDIDTYLNIKRQVIRHGYQHDITWCETVGPPASADEFFSEFSWCVLNSGMKEQIARQIWERIKAAITRGEPVSSVFGHPGKAKAIQDVLARKEELFSGYLEAEDKLAYLQSLPWIGPITKFHLAKNCGFDVCKPDRHLVRISLLYDTTPQAMCRALSDLTGDRIGTVDYVIWRAANLRII